MEWSEDQNLLVREFIITEPYPFKARTTERGKVWQQIADIKPELRSYPLVSLEEICFCFRETGVIAGNTNFSSRKRSLRYQSSKTSRVFLKDVMELLHESITLSSLVRRTFNATCSILICFSRSGGGVLAPGFLRQTHVLFTAASRVS